jgi:RNA polymerase sigma-70 factor, ECF subfamily
VSEIIDYTVIVEVAVLISLLDQRYPAHRLAAPELAILIAGLAEPASPAGQPPATAPFIDDILLAWACVGQDPQALREFEQTVMASAAQHLRDRRFTPDVIAESVQVARIAMLVSEKDRAPTLLQYRGRGPLRAFVRTVCTRRALTLCSNTRRTMQATLQDFASKPQSDTELDYMRATYGPQLSNAMQAAWTRLQPHDRFVLGLALEQGVATNEIARICGIHRASATRRIASARAALLALARDGLQTQLAVGGATLDSILRLFTTSVEWDAPVPPAKPHDH